MTPYRKADLPGPVATYARDLVYRPTLDHGRTSKRRIFARYALVVAPVLVIVTMATSWMIAGAFVVALVAWDVFKARRDRSAGIRIAIEGAKLVVEANGVARVDVPMASLLDVQLDTRTAHRASREVRPDGILASGMSFDVDESRIVLVVADRDPIRLTDAYFSQTDSLEWLGKIRMHLRNRGWVPEDERGMS